MSKAREDLWDAAGSPRRPRPNVSAQLLLLSPCTTPCTLVNRITGRNRLIIIKILTACLDVTTCLFRDVFLLTDQVDCRRTPVYPGRGQTLIRTNFSKFLGNAGWEFDALIWSSDMTGHNMEGLVQFSEGELVCCRAKPLDKDFKKFPFLFRISGSLSDHEK